MSHYWCIKSLLHEIKEKTMEALNELPKATFKLFIWRTTEPKKSYSYHPNPWFLFWVGAIIFIYYFRYLSTAYLLIAMIGWIALCSYLKYYWSGKWRSYKKRMEESK